MRSNQTGLSRLLCLTDQERKLEMTASWGEGSIEDRFHFTPDHENIIGRLDSYRDRDYFISRISLQNSASSRLCGEKTFSNVAPRLIASTSSATLMADARISF